MSRSVIGGKLLGLTLLSLSVMACMVEPDLEESTEDAAEELVASEVGAPTFGGDITIEDLDPSGGEQESTPMSIPGADRIEPEPIPWVPQSNPTDPQPKSGPSPLPT